MKRAFWKKCMWRSLGVFLAVSFIGLAVCVYKLIATFKAMATTGEGDAASFSQGIAQALESLLPFSIITGPALVFFLMSLFKFLNSPKESQIAAAKGS